MMIPEIEDDDIVEEISSFEEYCKIKKRNKFRGYFVYDKQYIERIEYRHSQSL